MKFEEIIRDLKKKEYQPIYFLHGEESYFIDLITKQIEDNVLSESEKSFNFTVIYGRDVKAQDVLDIARRYPMMAERQVVIIKEAQNMRDLAKLESYLEKPTPTTLLLICHKHKKVDTRTKFGKKVKAKTVLFESKKLYDNNIPGWVSDRVKAKSYTIAPQAAQLIAEYLGTNLSKIANELDKLYLNVPKGSTINVGHIEKHIGISKDYNVFELQNALGAKNIEKCNRIVNYFVANPKQGPMPMVTASLYNYFCKVYITSSMRSAPDNDLIKALKVRSAWFLKDYKLAANKYHPQKIEQIIHLLHTYDLRSKGVNNDSTSSGELLREMVYKILH